MYYKVDWLTVTVKPNRMIEDVHGFYIFLLKFLKLYQFKDDFEEFSGGRFYKYIMRYHNISFKIPDPSLSDLTGFGIEFTGQGLDYYIDYMRSKDSEYTVKNLLSALLGLKESHDYTVTFPRIDLAYDDISYEKKKHYNLDLDRIRDALVNLEFTSPFAIKKHIKSFEVTFIESQRAVLKGFRGNTIYLGSRSGNVFCRFYDKLAEMQVNKKEYDESIKHWTRMEFVFRNSQALQVVLHLITLSDADFSEWFSQVVNHYIRFVDVTENNRSNIHRCKSKKWWADFLGTVKCSRLKHLKPSDNHFLRFKTYVLNKVASGLSAVFECQPVDKTLLEIKEAAMASKTKTHDSIIKDYIALNNGYDFTQPPKKEGLEMYSELTPDYREFLIHLRKQREKHNNLK